MKPFYRTLHSFVFGAVLVLAAVVTALASDSCRSLFSRSLHFHRELPPSAVVIALGHDTSTAPLSEFARRVEKHLQRKVVTYRGLSEVGYVSLNGKWWDRLPTPKVTAAVESALRQAVSQCTNCQIIAFNLDAYDPKELFGPDGEERWSYTNFEVDLLLRNRELFEATRWYRNDRELSWDEAEKLWAPVQAALRAKSRHIGYGPLQ